MPQLDIVSFPNQIFSVLFFFFILFFIVSKNIIPSVNKIDNLRSFSLLNSKKQGSSFIVEGSKTYNGISKNFSDSSMETENQINILKEFLDKDSNTLYSKFGSSCNSNKKYLSSFINLLNFYD